MKKIIFLASFVAILASCAAGSSKGKWNAEDKEKAQAAVKSVDSQLSALGDKKETFVNCYLEKVENNYDNFAEADKDIEGCKTLATECMTEIMSK